MVSFIHKCRAIWFAPKSRLLLTLRLHFLTRHAVDRCMRYQSPTWTMMATTMTACIECNRGEMGPVIPCDWTLPLFPLSLSCCNLERTCTLKLQTVTSFDLRDRENGKQDRAPGTWCHKTSTIGRTRVPLGLQLRFFVVAPVSFFSKGSS